MQRQLKIIEQALMELEHELSIEGHKWVPEEHYLKLMENEGGRVLMIMTTDHTFWIYSTHPHVKLERRIGVDCPQLIEEIHSTVMRTIERHQHGNTGDNSEISSALH